MVLPDKPDEIPACVGMSELKVRRRQLPKAVRGPISEGNGVPSGQELDLQTADVTLAGP